MGREGFERHPQHRTMENLNRCDNYDDRVIWTPDSLTLLLLVPILFGRNILEMVGSGNRQQTSSAWKLHESILPAFKRGLHVCLFLFIW